jgi:hypothetical protein
MKIPITYPATSTTKIGASVTMLTSIVDGCSLDSFETRYGLRILSLIPLSRNCANLWRKLYYIKDLIHCYFKRILTKILESGLYKIKQKASVNNRCPRQCDFKVPEDIVTWSKENPLLRLDMIQRI